MSAADADARRLAAQARTNAAILAHLERDAEKRAS